VHGQCRGSIVAVTGCPLKTAGLNPILKKFSINNPVHGNAGMTAVKLVVARMQPFCPLTQLLRSMQPPRLTRPEQF
jgi:hypothetical protein